LFHLSKASPYHIRKSTTKLNVCQLMFDPDPTWWNLIRTTMWIPLKRTQGKRNEKISSLPALYLQITFISTVCERCTPSKLILCIVNDLYYCLDMTTSRRNWLSVCKHGGPRRGCVWSNVPQWFMQGIELQTHINLNPWMVIFIAMLTRKYFSSPGVENY
jgi:hypothetical protein